MAAGFIAGVSGRTGGYRLCRKPEEYSVGEILEKTEGPLNPVACLGGGAAPCPHAADCRTLPVWEKLERLVYDYLDSVKLSDLTENQF